MQLLVVAADCMKVSSYIGENARPRHPCQLFLIEFGLQSLKKILTCVVDFWVDASEFSAVLSYRKRSPQFNSREGS